MNRTVHEPAKVDDGGTLPSIHCAPGRHRDGGGDLRGVYWSQIGIHLKPCGILNVGGFYDGLIQQIHRWVADGLLRAEQAEQLIIDDDMERLLKRLMTLQPRVLEKWTEREKVAL